MSSAPEREVGILARWNDDRGFGFIVVEGKPDVFAHISSFAPGSGRPAIGDEFVFTRALSSDGKEQARDIASTAVAPKPARRRWPIAAAIMVGVAFAAALIVVQVLFELPRWVIWLYAIASAVTFVAYAIDKRAARRNTWRVEEGTLLVLGLLGGWPGALLAQETLRHKTLKKPFRAAFWGTVVINVLLMGTAATPLGAVIADTFIG
jgi:uncharacterized membrane protein YsdA (DUF1294 family)/cold shock CspA family protein